MQGKDRPKSMKQMVKLLLKNQANTEINNDHQDEDTESTKS